MRRLITLLRAILAITKHKYQNSSFQFIYKFLFINKKKICSKFNENKYSTQFHDKLDRNYKVIWIIFYSQLLVIWIYKITTSSSAVFKCLLLLNSVDSLFGLTAVFIKMPGKTKIIPPPPANSCQPGVARSLLYNGSKFQGHQKSKGNCYDVEVVLQVRIPIHSNKDIFLAYWYKVIKYCYTI